MMIDTDGESSVVIDVAADCDINGYDSVGA